MHHAHTGYAGHKHDVVVMEISSAGWQTLCVARFMCARVQQAGRQAHPVVGRTRTRHLVSTNWYLLLLKCPELVATFHLVFHVIRLRPPKCRIPEREISVLPCSSSRSRSQWQRASIISRSSKSERMRRPSAPERIGECAERHVWRDRIGCGSRRILRLISVGTRLWHGLVSSRQLS